MVLLDYDVPNAPRFEGANCAAQNLKLEPFDVDFQKRDDAVSESLVKRRHRHRNLETFRLVAGDRDVGDAVVGADVLRQHELGHASAIADRLLVQFRFCDPATFASVVDVLLQHREQLRVRLERYNPPGRS